MEIQIRPEKSGDREAIYNVNELAFGRPTEANIADKVRASSSFVPQLSLVAEREGEIIGHALFSEATVGGGGKSWTVLALGPIAVLPVFQRQGIGGQMIEAEIKRAADLGFGAVLLIGHPNYYPRFGFVPASRFGLEPTFSIPDDVFMARLLRPDSLDDVQGSFTFPPAFDES